MSTTNIYVLRLEGGNYYVGKTDNIYKRYGEHFNGAGSAWTRKHAPISLVKTVESASPFDEDKITKEYMAKYGVDKVRGGSYVSVQLSEVQKQSINAEIWSAKDLCARCRRKSHFVKQCYATTEVSGKDIEYDDEWGCDYCDARFTSEYRCMIHEKSCSNKQIATPRYVTQNSVV
jgi:predicted GIY-YIG superfamily endonuclease